MSFVKKTIYWLPRILSLCFVVFLSIFAFDVFDGNFGWKEILAFIVHLSPAIGLLVLSIIAWKYDLVGAVVFLLFALGYVFMVGLDRPWSWYASISGPSALIGIFYIASWWQKKAIKS